MLEVEAVEGAAKELVQLEDERYAHKRIFPYHFLKKNFTVFDDFVTVKSTKSVV